MHFAGVVSFVWTCVLFFFAPLALVPLPGVFPLFIYSYKQKHEQG
jgi:hypothetical protein